MLIDAPPPLLSTIIHKKHLSHFMAKTMNELAHKSPLISICYHSVYHNSTQCEVLTLLTILHTTYNTYILLEVLLCSIAEYFYELCRILASP